MRAIASMFAVALVGCYSTETATQDAFIAPGDGGSGVPALALMGGGAPDYGCLGTATMPIAGAPVDAHLHVIDFLGDSDVPSQPIEIWGTNVIGATCAAPDCVMVTTNAFGEATTTGAAGSWFAYRLPESTATVPVLAYRLDWPAASGGVVTIRGLSRSTLTTIDALLARAFTTTAGNTMGTVSDCLGRAVMNASVHLFRDGVEILSGPRTDRSTPRITGLQGTTPTPGGLTGDGGTFFGANLPPGSYRVEIYGATSDGGTLERVGCEEGLVVGGGISVFTVGALRGDHASGSGCGS